VCDTRQPFRGTILLASQPRRDLLAGLADNLPRCLLCLFGYLPDGLFDLTAHLA